MEGAGGVGDPGGMGWCGGKCNSRRLYLGRSLSFKKPHFLLPQGERGGGE